MPNNVETKMWLLSHDGSGLTDEQVEGFFSRYITVVPVSGSEDPRLFDFAKIIPQPENIWLGSVAGISGDNLKTIKGYGGLDAVLKTLKEGKRYPREKNPCLNNKQIMNYGLVNGLDWNRENWETKWGAYDSQYDRSSRYGGRGYAQVTFFTAWSVPEKILRLIRSDAIKQGFDIECEFGGELDNYGVYSHGTFMYWNTEWNEDTEEFEKIGDPIEIYQ